MYRQGDLLFLPLAEDKATEDRLRGCLREEGPYLNRVIIATGEKTGHIHQVKSREAEVLVGGGNRFLVAKEAVAVTHEEHSPLNLPAGRYQIIQQREQVGADQDRPSYD